MELFTWWDARGRRLPWLIALVLVLSGGYAAVAVASPPASSVAVAKARARYLVVTHKRALHWSWNCARPVGSATWRCRVRAWRGSYAGVYSIRVRAGKATIVGEGYARGVAHSAGVVPLSKVFLRSTRDAHEKCKADELMSRMIWHCEGWWGGTCVRPWLTKPNYVYCGERPSGRGEPVNVFWDKFDGKGHRVCTRGALYYAGANGTSSLKLTAVRKGSYRTTAWYCMSTVGGLPT